MIGSVIYFESCLSTAHVVHSRYSKHFKQNSLIFESFAFVTHVCDVASITKRTREKINKSAVYHIALLVDGYWSICRLYTYMDIHHYLWKHTAFI